MLQRLAIFKIPAVRTVIAPYCKVCSLSEHTYPWDMKRKRFALCTNEGCIQVAEISTTSIERFIKRVTLVVMFSVMAAIMCFPVVTTTFFVA